MISPGKQINVAVLIYPGVELLDLAGPMDVFSKANYFVSVEINGATKHRYNTYTVSDNKEPITSEGKSTQIVPRYSIQDSDCPNPDIVVIPGIMINAKKGVASKAVIDWIAQKGIENKTLLSICVGAFTLAATGLLAGKRATTHYLALKGLSKYPSVPAIIAVKNEKFVVDGNIVTTGGITCGIAGALHIVEKFENGLIAQQVADTLIFERAAPLPPYTLIPPYAF